MKRKKIFSKINFLFSNKKQSMETKNMEIKVSKVYMVGGVEYSSRDAAFKATAREVLKNHYEGGIEALIENAAEVRRALGILGSKE